MSLSVSSEHIFLQGGITISKQQNQLKGDIVEALQCVKCAIWNDLIFCAPAPSSFVAAEVNNDGEDDDDGDNEGPDGQGHKAAKKGWDELLTDDEDDVLLESIIDLD